MLLQTLSLKHAHSHTIRNSDFVELTASALKQRTRKNALLLDSSFVVAGNLERSFSQHCKMQHCCSLVPRFIPAFQCCTFQRAMLKSWDGPGYEASIVIHPSADMTTTTQWFHVQHRCLILFVVHIGYRYTQDR